MKRKISSLLLAFVLTLTLSVPLSFAATVDCTNTKNAPQFSILPYTGKSYEECRAFMLALDGADEEETSFYLKTCRNDVLGCGINTGKISFWMVPYFITYIANFLLGLSALICVLFIVIGGYRYVIGGMTEDKDKGKHTIRDALIGMGVALMAWTIVNVLIHAVTG